ncbi:uncharacterized protein LOC121373534 [Gigantopelta aegis]|uniref:uncharacterized protein LOC121373534 n=1 Tax=Gigantopelta aegis TaxID=1735272 RepID=UPI001B889BFE|nr:uncharacterized protein LOC121373534 [Gigantopelta aegis]
MIMTIYYICSVIVLSFLCLLPVECLRSEISVTRVFAQTVDAPAVVDLNSDGCGCVKYDCGCCAHLEVKEIELDDTVCVNVTYLPDQYGILLTVSVNGVVYINHTVSAKNPPALCFGIPYLKKLASLCIKLYDLDIKNHTLSGCARILVRLAGITVEKFDMGCFRIPPTKASVGKMKRFRKNAVKRGIEHMSWDQFEQLVNSFQKV